MDKRREILGIGDVTPDSLKKSEEKVKQEEYEKLRRIGFDLEKRRGFPIRVSGGKLYKGINPRPAPSGSRSRIGSSYEWVEVDEEGRDVKKSETE